MARIITYLIFAGFTLMMLYVGITQFIQQRRSMANATPIDGNRKLAGHRPLGCQISAGRVGVLVE